MKRILLLVMSAALPLAAQAGELDYNYVQAGYDYYHNSNVNRDAHGWDGIASAAIGQNFQLFGGGSTREPDGTGAKTEGWTLGAGFHAGIGAQTDFVGDASYHRANIDGINGHAFNYNGEIGVRSALAPSFEGWVMAGYTNYQNDTGDIDRSSRGQAFGKLGAQYKFSKNIGLVAEGTLAQNSREIFVGPRFSF